MKAINIISFDVPYPANYGGVIDVFFKIKALHSAGIKIHLHCFEYGRGSSSELDKYCESVNYYKRKTNKAGLLSNLPYIVKSRTSKTLKENLLKNDFPILFEGLHCCYLLNDNKLKNRFKIVRTHNIEHEYYAHLASNEKNIARRNYFKSESKKLEKFETIINSADLCLAISEKDTNYFSQTYLDVKTIHVPAFHQGTTVNIKKGIGDYALYHGNLSVNENKEAAKFIMNNIFNDLNIPLIIAGLNPDKEIIKLVDQYQHIKLIQNLSDTDLHKLIANAQVNLLYTHQATGLKLKLLNVLYNGRHCLVNSKMVEQSQLKDCCWVEDSATKIKSKLKELMQVEISSEQIEQRKVILEENYSNLKGAELIISHL